MSARVVHWEEQHQGHTVARNVVGRYLTLAIEMALGLVMLPYNAHHLGTSDYGLWMLAASIVAYFPVLDLGYGLAMERFVAHYRSRRDAAAISEIASTLVVVFVTVGLVAFGLMATIAVNLGTLFHLGAEQSRTGALVMICVAAQFSVGLPFAIFGAIVNGFQRTHLNAIVGSAVAVTVAAVNIAVVYSGGTLVQLVAALTLTRVLGYIAYRLNAYRVFPLLRIRPSLFKVARLREVSRFSVYMLVQDISVKMNYATDPMVIAAVLATGAVAVWTVAQRLADIVLQLTNQLNYVIFPIVVDCDSAQRDDRLRELLVQGTRLSLATTLPVAGALALLSRPVVLGWTGKDFVDAATIVRILALVVLVRVGSWTASTVLQGAGRHRLVSVSNLVAATVNVALSIVLIRFYGLPGVALATLVPVTIRAAFVITPAACRRAGISIARFAGTAVWPAVWPACITLGLLAIVRDAAATSLGRAVLLGGAFGLFYAALFAGAAISRADRERYFGKLRSLARRPLLEAA
jgi:O-antigen/teichoic acid export membrane protein